MLASVSHSAPQLFLGESLLEGIGAAAMLPATLAIISATFQGRERGLAFAVWGAVAGGAGALGPFVGGILTTDYSWRWAFRINVGIAPLVIIATFLVVRDSRDERAKGFDPRGVMLVTLGLLGLVFGIIGIGFATSQLTNVVLSDIPPAKAGSASGAAGMVRQVGTAFGIAVIGAIFVSQAGAHIRHDLDSNPGIPTAAKEQVVAAMSNGVGGGAAKGPADPAIAAIVERGIANGAKHATTFAGAVVTLGALISLLVPNIPPDGHPGYEPSLSEAEWGEKRRR